MPTNTETAPAPDRSQQAHHVPMPVQIVSIVFYAGFAISVSIVAMAMFGIIGIILAILFAWLWTQIPALNYRPTLDRTVASHSPQVPDTPKSSGNQSFDAYRTALMQRLEKEQTQFEGFLVRLRDAKDKHEFDKFMDDHARAARPNTPNTPETVGA